MPPIVYREMLDEIADMGLTTPWKKIRGLIKEDPRYAKFSSSDRVSCIRLRLWSVASAIPILILYYFCILLQKCEKEFIEYMKDKMVAAKAEFRELLKVDFSSFICSFRFI